MYYFMQYTVHCVSHIQRNSPVKMKCFAMFALKILHGYGKTMSKVVPIQALYFENKNTRKKLEQKPFLKLQHTERIKSPYLW